MGLDPPTPMTALIVVLLVLGATLLVVEAHVASYGVLGLAGVALLGLGGVLAVDAAGGSVLLALALVLPALAVATGVLYVAGRKTLQIVRRRPSHGADGLIGHVGVVRRALAPQGAVLIDGELWRARRSPVDDVPVLAEGEPVVVESVHGLTLSVRRAEEWEVLP
jgi:membrane-bound ClpP family serine protease